MYLMYVDESGDPGTAKHSSEHFALSGIIVPEEHWSTSLSRLKDFRGRLYEDYGLSPRIELHASELIRPSGNEVYRSIGKSTRMQILKEHVQTLPYAFEGCKVINVFIRKEEHKNKDIFELAWGRLLQRYEIYLKKTGNHLGMVIVDETDDKKLSSLLRRMRQYNPINSIYGGWYNSTIENIIEDPFGRISASSYFIQASDSLVHCLYRKEIPKGSYKKFGLDRYFDFAEPLLLKEASKYDPLGIVRK